MFSPDVMSVLEAGTSLIIGTVGEDGEPRATRAFALTVVDDAPTVRVLISADDPVAVEQLRTGRVAITSADVRTLRSVQLKGRVVRVEASTDADIELMQEHSEAFFRAIHETDGHDIALVRSLLPITTITIEAVVEELYDQTPGPGAGVPLELTP